MQPDELTLAERIAPLHAELDKCIRHILTELKRMHDYPEEYSDKYSDWMRGYLDGRVSGLHQASLGLDTLEHEEELRREYQA